MDNNLSVSLYGEIEKQVTKEYQLPSPKPNGG